MSTLNDTDLFVVERGGVQYKVEYADVDPITGELEAPVEVLTPLNGAGIGAGAPYNPISSTITTVAGNNITCSDNTELANMVGPISMTDENGDLVTPQTSEITNISGTAPAITLTFTNSTDLEYFQAGDVVQSGDWNQSQVWSDSLTGTGLTNPANAFSGDVDSYADSSGGWSLDLSGHTFGSGAHTIEVKSGGATSITVNNYTSIPDPGGGGAKVWTGTYTGEINSIASSATGSSMYYVKIDGNLLVNSGISNPNAVSVVSVDTSSSQMVVNGGTWSNGDVISLPTLEASATDVIGVDGNTLQISGVSGQWRPNLRIKGASVASSAPSPSSIVFTSMNGGTTAVTGTDATLASRVWTLQKSSAQTGPWTTVGEYTDLEANASQNGSTPWTGKPTLEENMYYKVKVKYTSDNANSVESVFNTFQTGDA